MNELIKKIEEIEKAVKEFNSEINGSLYYIESAVSTLAERQKNVEEAAEGIRKAMERQSLYLASEKLLAEKEVEKMLNESAKDNGQD